MPCSLTLGGYDEARFVPHQTNFNLNQSDGHNYVMVRGINLSTNSGKPAPAHWGSDHQSLSTMNTSFQAVIDSSTPYLWLPDKVADNFAAALNLTYNETGNLYMVDTDQFQANLAQTYSFTFSLSSADNLDNFGNPLDMPGVVNLTISSAAFAQQLHYPYGGIPYGARGIAYFPLKKLRNSTMPILGRAFLQETYLITFYDSGIFSLHQALWPDNPTKDAKIRTMQRPPNSPFPPAPELGSSNNLTQAQMAGIGAGIFILCLIMLLVLWYFWRKRRARKRRNTGSTEEADKDAESSMSPDALTPKAPVSRIFSLIIRRKRSRNPASVSGRSTQPAEVGADASHELFELPAPFGPVELDASSDSNSLHGDTELGTQATENLSAYEVAKRKLERQLQGPVPAYSPPASLGQGESSTGEKTMQDVSPVATYRPTDAGSPIALSPLHGSSGTLANTLPSPMSPHGDWPTNRIPDLPSPLTVAPPFPLPLFTGNSTIHSGPSSGPSTIPPTSPHSQTFDQSSLSRSSSATSPSPTSPGGSAVPPSPVYQRTPIDPSRVICLGPLPENVQLPTKPSLPRLVGPDGRSIPMSSLNSLPTLNPAASHSTDTLGSNYTEVEEQMVEEMTRQASVSQTRSQSGASLSPKRGSNRRNQSETPRSPERIDPGSELVHVPQLAEKRYSWEEPDSRDER
jgi:Eukaryotic aspartyl protease